MTSAISEAVERSTHRGEAFEQTGSRATAYGREPTEPPVRIVETPAPRGVDVCRLLVAGRGLSAGLAIPLALLLWIASEVLAGLGARVLAMLP